MPPELLAQFGPAEDALRAIGVVVWPMVEFEADDALGAAAARWADHPDVERVVILSPDKDMAQCVRDDGRVVTLRPAQATFHGRRRRRREVRRAASLDPGLPRAGRRLRGRLPGPARLGLRVGRRRAVALPAPRGHPRLGVGAGTSRCAARPAWPLTLRERRDEAFLYRELATLRLDAPIPQTDPDELRWRGPDQSAFEALAARLDAPDLPSRLPRRR